jgi:hypothetical protein
MIFSAIGHFSLFQDRSLADLGGLFQGRQILSNEAQGFFGHQTPTRWQIGAALQVPVNQLQITQQPFA